MRMVKAGKSEQEVEGRGEGMGWQLIPGNAPSYASCNHPPALLRGRPRAERATDGATAACAAAAAAATSCFVSSSSRH